MPKVSVWDKNGLSEGSMIISDEKIKELKDMGLYVTPFIEGVDADSHRFDFELSKVVDLEDPPIVFEDNKLSNVPEDSFVILNNQKFFPDKNGEISFQGSKRLSEELKVMIYNKGHKNSEGTLSLTPEGSEGHVLEQDYKIIRQGAYPSEREQIGALVKAVTALQKGEDIPLDAVEVFQLVEQVKIDTPKTEESKWV